MTQETPKSISEVYERFRERLGEVLSYFQRLRNPHGIEVANPPPFPQLEVHTGYERKPFQQGSPSHSEISQPPITGRVAELNNPNPKVFQPSSTLKS